MSEPTQPPQPKNVIERVREQLQREGKVRHLRTPKYITLEDGTEKRLPDALQWVLMRSEEVLELVALAQGNGHGDDEIVRALEKGHKHAILPGNKGEGTNKADDIFHLLDKASNV